MLQQIRKNRLRSVLTLVQIVLGALAMTLALSAYFGAGSASSQPERFDLVAGFQDANGTGSSYALMDEAGSQTLLTLAPDVDKASLVTEEWQRTTVEKDGRLYQFRSSAYVGEGYFELNDVTLTKGSIFGLQDAREEAAVMLISEGSAEILFGDTDPIGQTLTLMPDEMYSDQDDDEPMFDEAGNEILLPQPEAFTVIGIFAEAPSDSPESWNQLHVYLPIWKQYTQGEGGSDTLSVLAKPGQGEAAREQVLSAARQIYGERAQGWNVEERKDFYIREPSEQYGVASDVLSPVVLMFGVFGIVALMVGGIGILSSTLVNALERERDTGIRHALGATRSRVVRDMVLEASLLAGLGGVLGAGLAAIIIPLLTSQVGMLFFGSDLRWQPLAAFAVILTTLLLGLSLSFFPAFRSSRVSPVEALKGV